MERLNAAPPRAVCDGAARGTERTKQLIMTFRACLMNSPRLPTAAETAERAGYSVRSILNVFRHARLQVAATDRALDQAIVLRRIWRTATAGPTRYQVEIRRRLRAMVPLYGLVANQNDPEDLKLRIEMRELTIERLEATYARKLATLSALERTQTLIALWLYRCRVLPACASTSGCPSTKLRRLDPGSRSHAAANSARLIGGGAIVTPAMGFPGVISRLVSNERFSRDRQVSRRPVPFGRRAGCPCEPDCIDLAFCTDP